jgi:flagellar hook-associated protein 1 FlgK
MSNLIGLLDLGRSALLNHQKAVQVTGHNIANVNTPGYTRQRANLTASIPVSNIPGQIGMGVEVTDIQRVYDRFINRQIQAETEGMGRWQAQKGAFEKVELILDEANGVSLNQAMSEFWSAWQEVANNPDGRTQRAVLLSSSEYLATTFNKISADLQQLQDDLDISIDGSVDDINRIAAGIADLNHKIGEVEAAGQNANDYRDQRDQLLKDLSVLIDVQSFENDAGQVTVLVGDGRPLVENPHHWQLDTIQNAGGHAEVVWIDRDGNQINITPAIEGGKLKGWLDVRDVDIDDYMTRLDTMANAMITEVNDLHTLGFDLNGNAGVVFFNGTDAATIEVNPGLFGNPDLLAASGSVAGVPGDNSNAVAMAGLQHAQFAALGSTTFDDYHHAIIGEVGNGVRSATDYYNHQKAMTDSLDNYRESVSGVSLDEEMLNLVKFQSAYDAAAKMVTVIDELLDTVMNMAR